MLKPVSVGLAAAIARGDLTAIRSGEGWPHADTLDALRMARERKALIWLVMLDGLVIGDCGTHGAPDDAGEVEIGFGLAAPYRGRGYGHEMVALLVRALAARRGVHRLIAEVELPNLASHRLLERAGFDELRRDRAHVWYEREV